MQHRVYRKLLFWLACAAIVLTAAGAAALPWLAEWYAGWSGQAVEQNALVFVYLTVPVLLAILVFVAALGRLLARDKLFQKKSLLYLKGIMAGVGAEFLLYAVGLCIFRSLVCFVVLCGTAVLLLVAAVVRELLLKGIELQRDSDLTI